MKIRVLHQAIMVAMLGALASSAGAVGDPGKSTADMSKQNSTSAQEQKATRGSGVTSPTGDAHSMQGPSSGGAISQDSSTSQGAQGSSDLNSGSTDRSANAKRSTDAPSSSKSTTGMSGDNSGDTSAQAPAHDMSKMSKSSRHDTTRATGPESQRHAALRKCAQQSDQDQRESCLDEAIAQYGS